MPAQIRCIPPSGSQTLIGWNVSPWYPPRQVSSRRLAGRPRDRQYCRHILIATSTLTDPESHRNTWSSPLRSTRRAQSRTAGSWVRPPNITWLMRPIWACTAASRAGCRYPWIAAHHELIPSTSCRPSATVSRTPAAPVMISGSRTPGIGAYGCHTCARSSASRSAKFTDDPPYQRRPGVDQAGVHLHEAGAGVEHAQRVVRRHDPADPDHRQLAALGDERDDLAGPLGQRPAGQPA